MTAIRPEDIPDDLLFANTSEWTAYYRACLRYSTSHGMTSTRAESTALIAAIASDVRDRIATTLETVTDHYPERAWYEDAAKRVREWVPAEPGEGGSDE